MPCRHGDTLGTIGRLHQAAQAAGWRLVKWVPMIHPVADGTWSTPSNGTLFSLVYLFSQKEVQQFNMNLSRFTCNQGAAA